MKNKAVKLAVLALAVIMSLTCAVSVSAEDAANKNVVYYFVDCGDADPTTVNDGDSLGAYNSVTDQFFGKDSKTGKEWGVVDKAVDTEGQANYGDKRVTTTWTWVDTPGDDADKGASNRFCHDMKENGLDRVITYKFELPENGEYTIEVGFANPWGIAIPADVYLNGAKAGTCASTDTPVVAKASSKDGYLTVEAKSDMDTINLAYIIISGAEIKADTDSDDTTGTADTTGNTGSTGGSGNDNPTETAPQTGFAVAALTAAAIGAGAYIVSKKRR